MEEQIINICLEKLKMSLGIHYEIKLLNNNHDSEIDAKLWIEGTEYVCIVKDSLKSSNFYLLMNLCHGISSRYGLPIILAVEYTSSVFIDRARSEGVNIMDTAGNCCIINYPFFVRSVGNRNSLLLNNRSSLMSLQRSGLSVMLSLLAEPDLVNAPFRTIQEATGSSLGTIKGIFDLLIASGYVFFTNGERRLTNKDGLLSLFVENYNESVKKRLYLAQMAFLPGMKESWSLINLPNGMSWGGDCGAYMINKYLIPDEFELYSEVTPNLLFTARIAVPSSKGELKVYRKIWKGDNARAQAIVIYSDLMGKGDSRSIETAKLILNNELSYLSK